MYNQAVGGVSIVQYLSGMDIWSFLIHIQYLVNISLALIISALSLYSNLWVNSLWGLLIWSGEHGILAVIISVFSIILSYLLFWWINIRYGELISDFPKNFSVGISDKEGVSDFYIVLLLYNAGTPDIVIRDCRVTIKQSNKSSSFWCHRIGKNFRGELMIILRGHKGYSLRCEFIRDKNFPSIFLKEGECTVVLELRLQHRSDWIRHISRANVFPKYPRKSYEGEYYYLEIEVLDQPTAVNKIPEIREGIEQ